MGSIKFTINVEDSMITADKKYLTTRYTVYYFNPQDGRLANVESFTDTHVRVGQADLPASRRIISADNGAVSVKTRSEEHTSELQSLAYLVCRLLLEKKKNTM